MTIPAFTTYSLGATQDSNTILPSPQIFFSRTDFVSPGSLITLGDVPITSLSLERKLIIEVECAVTVNSSSSTAPQFQVRLLAQNGNLLFVDSNTLVVPSLTGALYKLNLSRITDRYVLFSECIGRFRTSAITNINGQTLANDTYMARRHPVTTSDILTSDTYVRVQAQYLSAGDGTLNVTLNCRGYLI